MRKNRVAVGLVAVVLFVAASFARSPNNVSEHLVQVAHAAELLDSYRGDGSILQAARAELETVLVEHPRNAQAHREMARYFIMNGSHGSGRYQPGSLEAADVSIKKAIEINPVYAEAYVLRGHLYRLMHRRAEAVAALQRAEKLGTVDPWLQNNWADLLIDEGKNEEAAARYRKVIGSRTPNVKAMAAAFSGLIRYYEATGKMREADKMYRKKIDLEPNSAWGYGNYARFLLCEKDDFDAAILRAKEALRIMDYGVARYWLAAALYRRWAESEILGNPDKGKRDFADAKAIRFDPHAIAQDAVHCAPLDKIRRALTLSAAGGKAISPNYNVNPRRPQPQ